MKLKSIGMIVRSGIVVVGGSAVVLVTAENLSLMKNAETFTASVPASSVPVSENVSEISSEISSESSEVSSSQSSSSPQSSSSASVETKNDPPVLSENSENNSTQPDISTSEQSSIPQSSEESKPPISSTAVIERTNSVSASTPTENISVSTASATSTSESSSSSKSSELSSTCETPKIEPPVSSITEKSSSVSEPTEINEPPEQFSTESINDTPLLPEPDEPDIVNINTASSDELQTLWGIDEDKAAAIIAYRERYGDFVSIYDIRRVDGIGDIVFEAIRNYITV